MPALPVAVLYGIYLGILTGIVPALVAWVLGFLFRYVTGVSIPGFAVLVLGIALAGVNGGLLALVDPSILQSANAPTVVIALLVVMLATLYAHNRGDQLGASFPRRLSWRSIGERTLSAELVEIVRNEATIRVTGPVSDVEGYPPLPEDLRAEIRGSEWQLPADLRVSELEARLVERLRTEYDLGDVSVSIDERGRASVAAAPPFSGLSKRVESGRRAVSVETLVPTGLARGDVVTVITPDAQVRGTVVSARSEPEDVAEPDAPALTDDTDAEGSDPDHEYATAAPTTTGGEGQVTVSVTRTDAAPLLRARRAKVIVEARGTRREYELLSFFRRATKRFRRLTVRAGGLLDGRSIGTVDVREQFGVVVLAVRTAEGWRFAPRGSTTLSDGDELFAVGGRDALEQFSEAVA